MMHPKYILCTIIIVLTGCSLKLVNYSNAPGVHNIVGQHYIITMDSFLLKYNDCPDSDAYLLNYEECNLIQSVGGDYLASSIEDYQADPQYWNDYLCYQGEPVKNANKKFLHSMSNDLVMDIIASVMYAFFNALEGCKISATIIGTIEKNTEIIITGLVNFPVDEDSRCWVVSGILLNQENVVEIQIPSCIARHLSPMWITSAGSGDYIPVIDNHYLVPKEN